MKKEEIHLWDLKRWFLGDSPPEFMIEVFLRTLFIFLVLLLVVRLMGKRMTGQMTLTEMAVMITMGAIVSPAMQLADRGLFFGVVGLFCALLFQRGLNLWTFKNPKVEDVTQGEMSLLVKDGRLVLEEMEKSRITKQQLYAMLRQKEITNLAAVKRGYLEACGIFAVYENEEAQAGLPIYPETDPVMNGTQHETSEASFACCNCGHVQQIKDQEVPCEICHAQEWSKAYLSK